MLGLKILDEVRWHDRWSSEIGRRLQVKDSSNDFFIFDERHSREEILHLLKDAPDDMFSLFEVAESPQKDCDFQTDSGRCYSHK